MPLCVCEKEGHKCSYNWSNDKIDLAYTVAIGLILAGRFDNEFDNEMDLADSTDFNKPIHTYNKCHVPT